MYFSKIVIIIAFLNFINCGIIEFNKHTSDNQENEEDFFPLAEGHTWFYETKEFKNDTLISSQTDSLIIGDEFNFLGKKGFSISKTSSTTLGMNPDLMVSVDTVFSKDTYRSGVDFLVIEFMFSETDTLRYEYSMGDYGLQRITYPDNNKYSYNGQAFRIQTYYIPDGMHEMVFISKIGIIYFKRTWKDQKGNEREIMSELINFKFRK